jgi:hypothetical protein
MMNEETEAQRDSKIHPSCTLTEPGLEMMFVALKSLMSPYTYCIALLLKRSTLKLFPSWVPVAHTCNCTYLGG